MNKFKKFILFNFIIILASCGTIKDGFKNPKKNNTDEFLVEKKSPLIMPPNYDELPKPRSNENKIDSEKDKIKSLITKKETNNIGPDSNENVSKTFEETLLEKIKNN